MKLSMLYLLTTNAFRYKENRTEVSVKSFFPNCHNGEIPIKEENDVKPECIDMTYYFEEEHRLYTCLLCKDETQKQNVYDLKDHYKIKHKGKRFRFSNYWKEVYPCEICGKEFKTMAGIKNHVEKHDMYFQCNDCDNSYKKLIDYIIHLQTHSNEGIFKCIVCEVNTNDLKSIIEHVTSLHSENENYKYRCEQCQKGFNLTSWFEEHNNFHTGLKPFDCDLCDKSFMYSRFLHAHKSFMHSKKKLTDGFHICVVCKKVYQCKSSLSVHMNSHKGNYAICDICGKVLCNNEQLKFHLRKHTGYKPFKCTYCEKTFIKKIWLIEHIRIHTGEKPYACNHCSKAFSQRTSLVIHIRSHTGERPYTCHLCAKGFVSKGSLSIHLKCCTGVK